MKVATGGATLEPVPCATPDGEGATGLVPLVKIGATGLAGLGTTTAAGAEDAGAAGADETGAAGAELAGAEVGAAAELPGLRTIVSPIISKCLW